jgi:hypothetical protein
MLNGLGNSTDTDQHSGCDRCCCCVDCFARLLYSSSWLGEEGRGGRGEIAAEGTVGDVEDERGRGRGRGRWTTRGRVRNVSRSEGDTVCVCVRHSPRPQSTCPLFTSIFTSSPSSIVHRPSSFSPLHFHLSPLDSNTASTHRSSSQLATPTITSPASPHVRAFVRQIRVKQTVWACLIA